MPADNSRNESEIIAVAAASPADISTAVAAARAALQAPSWRDIGASARGKLLYKLADLVETHAHTLATIETWDNGKPFLVARDEDLVEVAETLRYYAGWADKVFGQVIETTPDKFAYTIREPVGVCGQIIPYSLSLSLSISLLTG
jgi:aldehyde dehydrogenase (NAD+)